MDERGGTPATWFSEHSGLLLFAVGSVMVLTALIAGLLLDRSPATTVAILFIGAGMILVGALLPRIAGTIKITPGSIEMAIAERLEATRREAAQRVPGREDEAVARAMKALLAQLPVVTRDVATQTSDNGPAHATPPPASTPDGPPPPPPTRRSMRAWRIAAGAGAVAAVAVTAVLVTTLTLGGEPVDGVDPPPADDTEQPTSTDEPSPAPTAGPTAPATNSGVIAIGAASIVVVAALLFWLGWRARRVEPSLDDHVPRMGEPQEFARRIVDDL